MKIKILKKNAEKAFTLLAGINRSVSPGHVSKLAESIQRMDCIRPVIVAKLSFITGRPETYIIDGQHLFNALLRLNMDIPYLELTKGISNEKELIETIALLNASSKSWALTDYAMAWSHIINDYKKLLKYFQIYDLDLGTLASILSGKSATDGGSNSHLVKNGSFRISNEDIQVELLDCIKDVLSAMPRVDRSKSRGFVREYSTFVRNEPKYNHRQFMVNFKKEVSKFTLAIQQDVELGPMFKKLLR